MSSLELDSGRLHHDLDGCQQQVRRAYAACRQAVQEGLARHVQPPPAPSKQAEETQGSQHEAAAFVDRGQQQVVEFRADRRP
jgi:hypothetical protein